MEEEALFKRLLFAVSLFFAVFLIGSVGYFIIGLCFPYIDPASADSDTAFSLLNCFYMAAITVTTVGYGEVANYHLLQEPGETVGVVYTTVYLIISYLVVIYASANIVAALVEGAVGKVFQRRKMEKILAGLSGHYIVCGAGTTGTHIVDELVKIGQNAVVIDSNENIGERWRGKESVIPLVGDATDDGMLMKAALTKAKGIFPTLSDDKDNLVIALTARQANQDIRIVARATSSRTVGKLQAVGADAVISPNTIGGMRMASEMLRPKVVSFLDTMLRQTGAAVRFSEVQIKEGDAAAGRSLKELNIVDHVGLTVIGIVDSENKIHYNPRGSTIIHPGVAIIVVSDNEQLGKLEHYVKTGAR